MGRGHRADELMSAYTVLHCIYCYTLYYLCSGEPWAGVLLHYSMLVEWIQLESPIQQKVVSPAIQGFSEDAKYMSQRLNRDSAVVTCHQLHSMSVILHYWSNSTVYSSTVLSSMQCIAVYTLMQQSAAHQLISSDSSCCSTVYTSTSCMTAYTAHSTTDRWRLPSVVELHTTEYTVLLYTVLLTLTSWCMLTMTRPSTLYQQQDALAH